MHCPVDAAPSAGQYLQAHALGDELQAVPISVFVAGSAVPAGLKDVSLPIWARLPENWQPGTELLLRGPLGHGFDLPKRAKRVALAALAGSPGRLLPLVNLALMQHAEVVLCCDAPLGELPLAVEVQGLDDLRKIIRWTDYLALDIKLEDIEELRSLLGSTPGTLTAQALVVAPMPCGGLAQCGVCTLATSKGPRLACEDGPVFDLKVLL